MKFIVIEIQTNADNTVGTLLNSYNERNDAEQKYHLVLSSAAVSQLPSHAAVMLASDGREMKHECYHHALPEPEVTEPEEEPNENVEQGA